VEPSARVQIPAPALIISLEDIISVAHARSAARIAKSFTIVGERDQKISFIPMNEYIIENFAGGKLKEES